MMNGGSLKDIIAEHAHQLMDLDKDEQRQQSACGSFNAGTQSGTQSACGSFNAGPTNSKGSSFNSATTYVSSRPRSYSYDSESEDSEEEDAPPGLSLQLSRDEQVAKGPGVCAKDTSVVAEGQSELPAPPGLNMQFSHDEPVMAPIPEFATKGKEVNTSEQLEHATDLFKEEILAKHNKRNKITAKDYASAPPLGYRAAPAAAPTRTSAQPAGNLLTLMRNSLQEALSDPNLPADTAKQVWQLVQAEGQQRQQGVSSKERNLQAVKLLRQQLEKQQEESTKKIMKMIHGKPVQDQPMSVKQLRQQLEKQQMDSAQKVMKMLQGQPLKEQHLTLNSLMHAGERIHGQAWPSPDMRKSSQFSEKSAKRSACPAPDTALLLHKALGKPVSTSEKPEMAEAHVRSPQGEEQHGAHSAWAQEGLPGLNNHLVPLPGMDDAGKGCALAGIPELNSSAAQEPVTSEEGVGCAQRGSPGVIGPATASSGSQQKSVCASTSLVHRLRGIIFEDAEDAEDGEPLADECKQADETTMALDQE
mmetsp:Transcript_13741/g.26129  ORF Transcript_13741/g.26129 Transcript_13741/m.26129 type:complete len:531 (+) Transcript_13741:51-1643(+)